MFGMTKICPSPLSSCYSRCVDTPDRYHIESIEALSYQLMPADDLTDLTQKTSQSSGWVRLIYHSCFCVCYLKPAVTHKETSKWDFCRSWYLRIAIGLLLTSQQDGTGAMNVPNKASLTRL
ncbi:hypothetical protein CCHR01_15715 [Colletotrichum chrysophilum]|uniref:Uncharacterized protein n=1 Tax=Colletotrichum chrysophilum TaxID=1836956 RepID=A0AAD9A5T6_9PEZI|nr:hypothetical protein CCHR01_15715 [Colletotrichum chrysophilum]